MVSQKIFHEFSSLFHEFSSLFPMHRQLSCWGNPERRHKWHKNIFTVLGLTFQNVWNNCHMEHVIRHPKFRIVSNQIRNALDWKNGGPEINHLNWTPVFEWFPKPTKNEWVFTVPAVQHWCRIRASGAPATCSTAWRLEEPQVQLMQKWSEPSRHPWWSGSLTLKKLKKTIQRLFQHTFGTHP